MPKKKTNAFGIVIESTRKKGQKKTGSLTAAQRKVSDKIISAKRKKKAAAKKKVAVRKEDLRRTAIRRATSKGKILR